MFVKNLNRDTHLLSPKEAMLIHTLIVWNQFAAHELSEYAQELRRGPIEGDVMRDEFLVGAVIYPGNFQKAAIVDGKRKWPEWVTQYYKSDLSEDALMVACDKRFLNLTNAQRSFARSLSRLGIPCKFLFKKEFRNHYFAFDLSEIEGEKLEVTLKGIWKTMVRDRMAQGIDNYLKADVESFLTRTINGFSAIDPFGQPVVTGDQLSNLYTRVISEVTAHASKPELAGLNAKENLRIALTSALQKLES